MLGNDSDVDGDALGAVLASGPGHGILTLNTDGAFSYTPSAGFSGNDSFTYAASDLTAQSTPVTVQIAVTLAPNSLPTAANDAFTVNEDVALNVAAPGLLGNDADADGDTLIAVLVGAPAHGTLTLNLNGSFSYTPGSNFNGADSFTYAASDGIGQSGPATVQIIVNPVNDAPVSVADSHTVAAGTTLTVPAPGLLGNDIDADGDALTAVAVSGPIHGTISVNPDGSFNYTPSTGFRGTDSFTYMANDGTANGNVVAVTISVTGTNATPVAQDVTVTRGLKSSQQISPLAAASDAEGGPLTLSIATQPSFGTVAINDNGTPANPADDFAVYTPNPGSTRRDMFTYRVTDDEGASTTATVNVNVSGAALIPHLGRPSTSDLLVLGTDGNDVIKIRPRGAERVEVILNGQSQGVFAPNGRIIVKGLLGDDVLYAKGVKLPADLYGGLGDDVLVGTKLSRLVGGGGDDTVTRARAAVLDLLA